MFLRETQAEIICHGLFCPVAWWRRACQVSGKEMELYQCFMATESDASLLGSSFCFGWVWEPNKELDCPCCNAWRCSQNNNAGGFFVLLKEMSGQARKSSCGVLYFTETRSTRSTWGTARTVQRLADQVLRWTSGQVGSEGLSPSRLKGQVALSMFWTCPPINEHD